jgi:hypothetical protein
MNPILEKNYEAIEWMYWFEGDYKNLKDLCNEVWRGGLDKTSLDFQEKLKAIDKAISEMQDDTIKIKAFIDAYK